MKKNKVEKHAITIVDIPDGHESTIKAKISDEKRSYKIVNGKGFAHEGKTRAKVVIKGDNESVEFKGEDGCKTVMSFGELCSLQELLNHIDDLPGHLMFGKTEVKKSKPDKKSKTKKKK